MPDIHGYDGLALKYPITSDLLTSVALWIRSYKRQFMTNLPVTVTQFLVLDILSRDSEGVSPSHIAHYLGVTQATASNTLDRLEMIGLIERTREPRDHRVVKVRCSKNVYGILEEGSRLAHEVAVQQLIPLGAFLKNAIGVAPDYIKQTQGISSHKNMKLLDLYRVCIYIDTKVAGYLRGENQNLIKFRILFELLDYPQGMTTGSLAGRLLVLLPDVAKSCRSLELQSLIVRQRDARDKRVVHVSLSSEGYALLKRTAPHVDTLFLGLITQLGADSREHYLKASRLIVADQQKRFKPE